MNAIIDYEIVPGLDGNLFKLVDRRQENAAELLTNTELDFESNKKVYNLVVRASSPPLRSDVEVEIFVSDVNDNIPRINDFTIVFNNYKNHFPLGVIGKAPGYDVDVNDVLKYRFVTGNRANLILLNETNGDITLSPVSILIRVFQPGLMLVCVISSPLVVFDRSKKHRSLLKATYFCFRFESFELHFYLITIEL